MLSMMVTSSILSGSAAALGGCLLLLMNKRRRRRNAITTVTAPKAVPDAIAHGLATPLGARLRPSAEGYNITVGLMGEVARGLQEVTPFPPALMEVMQELDSAGASAQTVAAIVSRETILAATLLRIANSAAFGIQREIVTIADAVAYLGFSTTKALFLRLKVDTIFPQLAATGCYDGKKLWSHSVAVAQTADELARRAGGCDPHLALTAGLLHDIGKMAINSRFPDSVRELWAPEAAEESFLSRERRLFGADHAVIGGHLAKQWKLPQDLTDMIRLHHFPVDQPITLRPPVKRALYAIFVANQIVKYCHVYCSQMEIDPIPAEVAAELGLPAEPEKLLDDRMRQKIHVAVSLNRRAAAPESTSAAA
jgi:putative nucleotidyltransferase with HDIG domain